MRLPAGRGPLSGGVIALLARRDTWRDSSTDELVQRVRGLPHSADLLTDDDFQLALWVLYELHYAGFADVDPDLEWDPETIRLRRELEARFEVELRRRAEPHVARTVAAEGDLAARLFELAATFEGPSLARYLHRDATLEQFLEFMVHRSIYHLKESDPHSWVIPRITGKPKAALVELQYDEYGGGRPERLHATMFGDSLQGCGLSREYGAYLDQVPGYTLAGNNAMSLLGLHRRLRGAAMGHLGAFEATSSLPCRKYAGGVRRLGLPEVVAAYFDEHVEADAVHEQLAFRDICASLVSSGQATEEDVVLGAAVCLLMDAVAGEHMLADWQAGRSTLRGGTPVAAMKPASGVATVDGVATADGVARVAAAVSVEAVAS